MGDELTYRASLKVGSAILSNIAAALLIELPFTGSWSNLTYHVVFYILTTITAITIERYLET